jgi:type I restriction enzyme S subunit
MQGRIVDLIDHLDDHLANLRAERASADSVLDVVRSFVPEGPDRPIGDLVLGIDSGRSPLTDGEVPITGEPRILKLSAVRPGLFDATEAKRLSAVHGMPGSTLVGEGDVLVTRSNTPDRVGYCARARGVPVETYLPDLIWRVRLDTKECDADYFEQVLSSRLGRALVTNAASGTSQSMRKINKAGFSSLAIPLPSLGEQRRYAGDALAVWETVLTIDREVRALSRVRNAVLHSLLTRSVEIPESYDSSVGEAV